MLRIVQAYLKILLTLFQASLHLSLPCTHATLTISYTLHTLLAISELITSVFLQLSLSHFFFIFQGIALLLANQCYLADPSLFCINFISFKNFKNSGPITSSWAKHIHSERRIGIFLTAVDMAWWVVNVLQKELIVQLWHTSSGIGPTKILA